MRLKRLIAMSSLIVMGVSSSVGINAGTISKVTKELSSTKLEPELSVIKDQEINKISDNQLVLKKELLEDKELITNKEITPVLKDEIRSERMIELRVQDEAIMEKRVAVLPEKIKADDFANLEYYSYISEKTGLNLQELRVEEKQSGDLEAIHEVKVPLKFRELEPELTFDNSVKKDENYYEFLSAYTEESVDYLKTLEKENGDLLQLYGLGVQVDTITPELVEEVKAADVIYNGGSFSSTNKYPMSSSQWSYMKNKADKGDILVSKDSTTFFVNHGHAAIVSASKLRTVEHTGDGKSDEYNIDRWAKRWTMRDYYPSGTSQFTRDKAADYAYSKLRGWKYSALPGCKNSKKLNCATLVWKAYHSQSVDLQKTWIGGCVPKCFVTGKCKTTYWAGVNWSGGTHSW